MNENLNGSLLLNNAYSHGTYENAELESTFASRELLLREHVLTSLYWFPGKNPLSPSMLGRVDEVLTDTQARNAYMEHYRNWGQQMRQAELEGMALSPGPSTYMRADSTIEIPKLHHPQLVLDFIAKNYTPGVVTSWGAYTQEAPREVWPKFCDRLVVRTREAVCQLGVFLEYATQDPSFSNYLRVMERALFTMLAINPVVRLGMPSEFSTNMRQSIYSFALYFYLHEDAIRKNFEKLPESHYSQLLECLSDMANLIPANRGYSE
jgi:hypothetical protein